MKALSRKRSHSLPAMEVKKWLNFKAFELRLTGRDVLTILPTGYGKSWIYQGFFGKAFRFEPECERISDFAAYKHFVNSIAGEQFWNMNWLT